MAINTFDLGNCFDEIYPSQHLLPIVLKTIANNLVYKWKQLNYSYLSWAESYMI